MEKRDGLQWKGSFAFILRKGNGDVEVRRKDNMVLNTGFDFVCNAVGAASARPGSMSHIAVGTGTTAVAATQSALVTELARKSATYAHTAGTKVMTFTTTFEKGEATGAITEAGLCNAATGGIFMDRVTFAVINKASDDVLTINLQFTLSEA